MAGKIMVILALGATLMACSKEPKSVTYYTQHEPERQALLKTANDNPGKYKDDPDVINAVTAERNEQNRKFFKFEKTETKSKGVGIIKLD